MSAKADQLRNRLSINPDDPPPTAPPQPQSAPGENAPTQEPTAARTATKAAAKAQPPRGRRAGPSEGGVPDALDDPDIHAGRKSYRSFYIDDEAFARFRAAIHWCSRRPDAVDEVPENMSAAVEAWMLNTAQDLERRYNDTEVFRMPPKSPRRPRAKKRPT